MKRLLITGGAGFIGSAMVRMLISESEYTVVNVDKLTYAGNLDSVAMVADSARYRFEQTDICDDRAVRALFVKYAPDGVVHLAAESHVDRSIDGPRAFVETNVFGTFTLLQEALRHWRTLSTDARDNFRFVHVSTDEVFGSLGTVGSFLEDSPYAPNSPYAATKAASDHLARAWHHTFGLPVVTTNCSNNYGPYQFPEKLIPLTIANALAGRALPVYGTGENVRDWLYVEDHVRALLHALEQGVPGETYNIGGDCERRNIDVVRMICALLDELAPSATIPDRTALIRFVDDRPGHDHRYAIDASKIGRTLGWHPRNSFALGLRATVQWYLDHGEWMDRVLSGAYRGERLGQSGVTERVG